MKIGFMQVYTEPGINFPFSHHVQYRLSEEVEELVSPSAKFVKKFADDFKLIFYVGAKQGRDDNEITGPRVFKKAKDVEYSVFTPFDLIMRHRDAPKVALEYVLKGACDVFDRLEIDTTRLRARQDAIIAGICADPTMLEEPSWDEEENKTHVRRVFTKFFEKGDR